MLPEILIILSIVCITICLFMFIDSRSVFPGFNRHTFLIPLFIAIFSSAWFSISQTAFNQDTNEKIINPHITDYYVTGHGKIQLISYKHPSLGPIFINCQSHFGRIINEDTERVIVKQKNGDWYFGVYHRTICTPEIVNKEFKYNSETKRYEFDPFNRIEEK